MDKAAARIVLPFFRASVRLQEEQAPLFEPALPHQEFLTHLRGAPLPFRHNIQRVLVACETALHEQASIALAEGWLSNRMEAEGDLCTGAEVSERMIQLLQSRGLTDFTGEIHRLDESCCTWQEVQTVHRAFPQAHVIGVSSSPNPSATRARRVLKKVRGPSADVRSTCHLGTAQQEVFDACAVSSGWITETINWMVHGLSEIERELLKPEVPLEMRLAMRLRGNSVQTGN